MLARWSVPQDPHDSGNRPDRSASQPRNADHAGESPILVVEDDVSILDMVMQILRAEGYPVVGAKNGVEGVAQAERRPPSLILLLASVAKHRRLPPRH